MPPFLAFDQDALVFLVFAHVDEELVPVMVPTGLGEATCQRLGAPGPGWEINTFSGEVEMLGGLGGEWDVCS